MESIEEDEEEKLVQMIHEFIESESSSSSVTTTSSSNARSLISNHYQATYFTLQEILRSETKAEQEIVERVKKHLYMMRSSKREDKKSSGWNKYLVMKLRMEGFNAFLCHSSWITSTGCSSGDYEYIDIKTKDEKGRPTRLIVDIDFKSQFELARPTPSYKQLTDTLPTVFVGDEEKLSKIINILCSAAKQSLKEKGLHVPPWRTTTYMHSKWLSESGFNPNIKSIEASNPPENKITDGRNINGSGSGLSTQFSTKRQNLCQTFAAAN